MHSDVRAIAKLTNTASEESYRCEVRIGGSWSHALATGRLGRAKVSEETSEEWNRVRAAARKARYRVPCQLILAYSVRPVTIDSQRANGRHDRNIRLLFTGSVRTWFPDLLARQLFNEYNTPRRRKLALIIVLRREFTTSRFEFPSSDSVFCLYILVRYLISHIWKIISDSPISK